MKKFALIFTIFVLCLLPIQAFAQVSVLINFQGKLTDPNKAPIEGQVDIKFAIYDAETGGNLLWEENHSGIIVTNGIFNVLLGSGSAVTGDLSITFTGADRWLEVKVGTDMPMTPRQRIASVAYSIHSKDADNALTANDVPSKDITPKSITISGYGVVIDSNGKWVGDPTGLVGPPGPAGPQGPQGPAGSSGSASYQYIDCMGYDPNRPVQLYYDCSCPSGKKVVSGGGWTGSGVALRESRPVSLTTWRIACDKISPVQPGSCHGMTIICTN